MYSSQHVTLRCAYSHTPDTSALITGQNRSLLASYPI